MKKITQEQRLQLIGLRALSMDLNRRLDDYIRAAAEITGESDPAHTADMMSGYRDVDSGLLLLKIVVEPAAPTPTEE